METLETIAESIAVTPPTLDTPAVRAWIEETAASQGWTDMEWREDVDVHGLPMGRLVGRRPR